MTSDTLTSKDLITVVLKEYDALRKGIDDRLDVTRIYGWPVVLLSFGAIAGLKSELVSLTIALSLIPAIVLSIAALDANANHDKARARRALALVEDKIFILAGNQPLLSHESKVFLKCRDEGSSYFRRALGYSLFYAVVEAIVSLSLLRPQWGLVDWSRSFLFVSVLLIPPALLLYSAYGVYRTYTKPLVTRLMSHIENSMSLESDGNHLLYNTKPPVIISRG